MEIKRYKLSYLNIFVISFLTFIILAFLFGVFSETDDDEVKKIMKPLAAFFWIIIIVLIFFKKKYPGETDIVWTNINNMIFKNKVFRIAVIGLICLIIYTKYQMEEDKRNQKMIRELQDNFTNDINR